MRVSNSSLLATSVDSCSLNLLDMAVLSYRRVFVQCRGFCKYVVHMFDGNIRLNTYHFPLLEGFDSPIHQDLGTRGTRRQCVVGVFLEATKPLRK